MFEMHSLQQLREHPFRFPLRYRHFNILWVTQGDGLLKMDPDKFPLSANRMYCILPRRRHRLELGPNAEGVLLSFSDHFIDYGEGDDEFPYRWPLLYLLGRSPDVPIGAETTGEVGRIIQLLQKELGREAILQTEAIKTYLNILLVYVARPFAATLELTVRADPFRLVRSFFLLVEKHFASGLPVKGYADLLSITPNYLNIQLNQVTGHSARFHIRRRQILEARRRLVSTGATLKEIAHELGYEDAAHFSRMFKRAYGKNFTDFKKESCYDLN